jgi:SAM-dependent methyltransferase
MIRKQTHGESIKEGHLGGCDAGGDTGTYYPIMWKYLINNLNIKSVLDIGCGIGYALDFFKDEGIKITGIEGSKKAIELSLVKNHIICHDFSKSTIQLNDTFDLCWCCEFVEHVEEIYMENFLNLFKKCKYIAMTFAPKGQGGHHHVNEQDKNYWINKLQSINYRFNESYTNTLRNYATKDVEEHKKQKDCPFFTPHFLYKGLFFERIE